MTWPPYRNSLFLGERTGCRRSTGHRRSGYKANPVRHTRRIRSDRHVLRAPVSRPDSRLSHAHCSGCQADGGKWGWSEQQRLGGWQRWRRTPRTPYTSSASSVAAVGNPLSCRLSLAIEWGQPRYVRQRDRGEQSAGRAMVLAPYLIDEQPTAGARLLFSRLRDARDALLKPAAAARATTESHPPQTLSFPVPTEVQGLSGSY
jgi:hypothetical protein